MTVVPFRNRIVGQGLEDPARLIANPANWRVHPVNQRRALRGALEQVGWVQQVIVNQRTGYVVDGHARVALALERQEAEVPVVYVDLSAEEEALVLATLDPIGAMADRDQGKLDELLAGVAVDTEDLSRLLGSLGRRARPGLTDPDDAPDVLPSSALGPGALFALGRHRVLCGDSTKAADVGVLLGDARPRLTITDPPYGVNYEPEWRNEALRQASWKLGRVEHDSRADWREAWGLSPSDVFYVWHGGLHAGLVVEGLATAGLEVRSQIIWVKPALVISRGAYHWQHEPCWYAVRKGRTADWLGDRKQSTAWFMDPPPANAGHHGRQRLDGPQHPEARRGDGSPDPQPRRGRVRPVRGIRIHAHRRRDPRPSVLRDGD